MRENSGYTDIPTSIACNTGVSFAARGLFAAIVSCESVGISELGRRDTIGILLRELSLAGITEHLSHLRVRQPKMDPYEARDKVTGATGDKVCEWCFRQVHILHNHHFPIPYAAGGIDTVAICGACHADYHFFTGK